MAEPNYHMTLKIILLGDYSVNKGTLLRALNNMPHGPEAKCLGFSSGVVELLFVREGKHIRVRLYDTAGQERFRSITSSYYRGAHGCILMFDLTQKSTFEGLSEWHRELHTNSLADDIVVTLVGCRSHVTGTGTTTGTASKTGSGTGTESGSDQQQVVAKRVAQELADFLGVPYEELSVQDVAVVVQTLGRLVDRIVVKTSRSGSVLTTRAIKPAAPVLTLPTLDGWGHRRKCAC
ncbi:hypothetical protein ACOMHN_031812 [Nucella lapillus]